ARPPPTPSLFPYTTLFRSRQLARARGVGHVRRAVRRPSGPAPPAHVRGVRRSSAAQGLPDQPAPAADRAPDLMAEPTRREIMLRSEEHTSELQSLRHLVCR